MFPTLGLCTLCTNVPHDSFCFSMKVLELFNSVPQEEMKVSTIDEIVMYLRDKKGLLYNRYGVTRMGIFGSFVQGDQTIASDVDMVVEFQNDRKNIHSFLNLKRFLEKELSIKVDLGFEHSLKPIVRENIKDKIIYV